MRLTRAFSAALAAAFFAAGCSGGGGGGGGGNGGDPPIADAGDDAAARIYQSYTLDGAQSSDPEGKDLTFAWSVISAPDGSAVTLTSGGAAANVAFTPDAEGIYLFGLVVSDGKKLSTLDTVEVSVDLRVAVFADPDGDVAREVELYGAGDVDDYYGWPDSYLFASVGDVAIFYDERDRRETLIAYRVSTGTQELLVSAEEISYPVRAAGDHVVWLELREGQWDLFTRDLATGEEIRITSTEAMENLGQISPDFVTFTVDNPPYGVDSFVYDFTSHGLTNLTGVTAFDDNSPVTDGDTILYTTLGPSIDVYAYDVTTQATTPLAVATTANEYAYGVSGNFAILGVNTNGGTTLYRVQLSDGQRTPFEEGFNSPLATDGDYFAYTDGADVRVYRMSTNTVTTLTDSGGYGFSLRNGVAAWPEYNGGTNSYDVKFKALPAGAVTTIAGGDANVTEVLDSGIAWDAHDGDYIYEVFYSGDGGTTIDHASDGKVFLTDRLADYDVAIVGGDIDSSFGTDTIEALSAAGIPILSFDRGYASYLFQFGDDYALDYSNVDCGEAAIRFSNSTHPAFAGFPAGGYAPIDTPDLDVDTEVFWIDPDDLALPTDFVALATYDLSSSCLADEEDAIVTFTNDDGVAVILDASATTFIPLWNQARRDLVISELRYLASTRAP